MAAINLLDVIDIYANIIPIDLHTGSNAGGWISMRGVGGMLVIVFAGAGAAGDPLTMTLNQGTSISGGGSKVATVITKFFHKTLTSTLVTAGSPWTVVTQAAASTWVLTGAAGNTQRIGVLDVRGEQLDVANGFCYIKNDIAQAATSSQIGCSLYIPYNLRYIESTANKVSLLT